MTFDRRQTYDFFKSGAVTPKSMSFIGTTYVMNEVYLEGTTDWVLQKPLLIGNAKGYKFYIGTQIGNAGTSLICMRCKSVVKYYWSESNLETERIEKIFERTMCPRCGQKINSSEKPSEILRTMSMFASEFKAKIT